MTVAETGPDVGESPNHYAVLKSYADNTCASSSYIYFESYNGDVCIPLTITIRGEPEEDASVMFKDGQYSEAGEAVAPYMKIYGANRKCVGAQTTKVLSTECSAGDEWDFVYYDESASSSASVSESESESASKKSSTKSKGKGKA